MSLERLVLSFFIVMSLERLVLSFFICDIREKSDYQEAGSKEMSLRGSCFYPRSEGPASFAGTTVAFRFTTWVKTGAKF